ncbi:MAG: sulfite exporter TauE/SafE family protein [Gammaproteobacteria bacterium]|nr:MAG: sulfite exporter TauE/SafE family protein [Gammaproteobacteria bacterium]
MDFLRYVFPVSGVETWLWLPPLAAFAISFFTSMVGVSGAFLLLPFQMSVLHYTTPSVSATNLVFNLVAIPSGVYRYMSDGRMNWPLLWAITVGTLPGVVIGYYVRVWWLPDPAAFKIFAGCVLLYLAWRLLPGFLPGWRNLQTADASVPPRDAVVRTLSVTPARVTFRFGAETHAFNLPAMLVLAFLVGIVGGVYGIGGGAIIAPFCIAFFRLPVHAIAGATLAATFLTSIAGVAFYNFLPAPPGLATHPDWLLGVLFGVGGALGMYAGARLQRYVPHTALKALLGALVALLAVHYLLASVTSNG